MSVHALYTYISYELQLFAQWDCGVDTIYAINETSIKKCLEESAFHVLTFNLLHNKV